MASSVGGIVGIAGVAATSLPFYGSSYSLATATNGGGGGGSSSSGGRSRIIGGDGIRSSGDIGVDLLGGNSNFVGGSGSGGSSATFGSSGVGLQPYFDFDVQRNLTVTVGQTGFLHCRVERLGDKDVSWIRKRDLHILTAGTTVYTSDQRFQVTRSKNLTNWTLQIKYPQLRDAGVYECQINTEPKMSLFYTFNVVEMKAVIVGPTDLYVKSGSDINLMCNISQGPHDLANIFWYKGNEIVDMVSHENEIYSQNSKHSQRITVDHDWADGLTSRLKIRKATPNDSGNYSCVPTIAKPSSVYVHVILGEHPAAMQHNNSANGRQRTLASSIFFYYYVTLMVLFLVEQLTNDFNRFVYIMKLNIGASGTSNGSDDEQIGSIHIKS